jgi:hypothetical protein
LGYFAHATTPPTPGSAVEHAATEHQRKPSDTIVWRDEIGTIYRATLAPGQLDDFRRLQHETLEAARMESRSQVSTEIAEAVKPVFAGMRARVPAYTDWYLGYTTKYELMAHAVVPALDYLSRNLIGAPTEQDSLVRAMGPHGGLCRGTICRAGCPPARDGNSPPGGV